MEDTQEPTADESMIMRILALFFAAPLAIALFWSPILAHAKGAARHAVVQQKSVHKGNTSWRKRYRPSLPRVSELSALSSGAVLIFDPLTRKSLFQRRADVVLPIASLTKLMTALVVVESSQSMTEQLTVTPADVDRLKFSSSRLRVGARLPRSTLLHIALMSSENRAASALGRNYPGGTEKFVMAMNAKALALGMTHTRFAEPTGLSSANVSTPADLAKLVVAAQQRSLIRSYSTDEQHTIRQGRAVTTYRNSNRLISSAGWNIGMQKTGYTSEAGRCMVLHAVVRGRAVVMVFLGAQGKFSRATDANSVRSWLVSRRRAPRSSTK